ATLSPTGAGGIVAKQPKLLTYAQWEALHQQKQAKAAERKAKRRQQWKNRTATQNYLRLTFSRMTHPGPVLVSHAVRLRPDDDGDLFDVEIRPDKRRGGWGPLQLSLTVDPQMSTDAIVAALLKVIHILLHDDIQAQLRGVPLEKPMIWGLLAGPAEPPTGQARRPLAAAQTAELHREIEERVRQFGRKDQA